MHNSEVHVVRCLDAYCVRFVCTIQFLSDQTAIDGNCKHSMCNNKQHQHSFQKFKLISSGWFNWFNRKKMKQIPNYWIYIMDFFFRDFTTPLFDAFESMGKKNPNTSRKTQLRANKQKKKIVNFMESKKEMLALKKCTFFIRAFMHSYCDNVIVCSIVKETISTDSSFFRIVRAFYRHTQCISPNTTNKKSMTALLKIPPPVEGGITTL